MVYLDHRSRRPRLIAGKQDRRNLVDAAARSLRGWRLSPFEHEAVTRRALRLFFIGKGGSWPESDGEAASILASAMAQLGLERPSWIEGQWQYTAPRQHCLRCAAEISEEDQARGFRFCSSLCSTAAFEQRVAEGESRNLWLHNRAWQENRLRAMPERPCKVCGTPFRALKASTFTCSPVCTNKSKQTRPDLNCLWCGEIFHQESDGHLCCSPSCASQLKVDRFRKQAPEQSCPQCAATFRPSKKGQVYCSSACRRNPAYRAAEYRRSQQRKRQDNVIYLTPEIFDGWFREAA